MKTMAETAQVLVTGLRDGSIVMESSEVQCVGQTWVRPLDNYCPKGSILNHTSDGVLLWCNVMQVVLGLDVGKVFYVPVKYGETQQLTEKL